MDINEHQGHFCPSWNNLPSDIFLLLFDYMPTSSLIACMFVSQTWRDHVEHVLEVKNKWEELFNNLDFKIKCKRTFGLRRMYYNYVRWHSVQKATVKLHHVLEVDGIKKINIYRDHLIVVTNENVQYYGAKTLHKQSTVEWLPCEDFFENDVMAVEVFKQGKYMKLQLLLKLEPHPIYRTQSDVLTVDNVISYKIHNDECHVLDHRNSHSVYTIVNGKWQKEFLARYYGNPDDSCAINVFDNRCYLILKGGFVLWMDSRHGNFQKMTRITAWKSPGKKENKMPLTDRKISVHSRSTNRKMFLWCCLHDVEAKHLPMSPDENDTPAVLLCSRTEPTNKKSLCIERYARWANPLNESVIFPFIIRNVSCMLLHSDILFLGHLDGTVEMISSRDLSRDIPKTEPLRRFNVTDFKKDIPDAAVLSIDVYEEQHLQHMFIATYTHILHLHITHPRGGEYIWSDEVYKSIMIMP